MDKPNPRLVESGPLAYLLSVPAGAGPWPLLCFLHGYDEGAPMPIRKALTLHGPLAPASSAAATQFLIVAPQLPTRGDLWYRYGVAVRAILEQVLVATAADPQRMFLTGFSYGANGVFDLALDVPGVWAGLWPVDPTRVPGEDPGRPVWFSSGEISRRQARAFIQRLRLEPAQDGEDQDRVYQDDGQDHVDTARLAYGDDRIYRWLLRQPSRDHRASSPQEM